MIVRAIAILMAGNSMQSGLSHYDVADSSCLMVRQD